ncbi:MAG: MFS transporter [Beijerinckiaceae bacterium]
MNATNRDAAYGRYRALYGLLVVSLGSMMGPLDAAVNVAFPVITSFFSLRISDIQWIVIVYVLAQSCLTIVFGNLGDLYGHKRIFMIGTIACAIVHLLAGFAPNYPALVALRVFQGLSVGIALSCGPAIVTFLYPPAQKRYALGLFTMLFGIGLAIGPVVGGWLLERYGWPAVFWYRTPIALLAFILAIWLPLAHEPPLQKPQFDKLGAVYLILTLASFVAFISMTRRSETILLPLALFALWIAATLLFARQELRAPQPVINVRHYGDPLFAGIQITTWAVNFFLFVIFLLLPYMMKARGDVTLFWSGVVIAVYPCGTITGGYAGGRLSRSVSSLALVRIGLAIMAVGLIAIGFAGPMASVVPTMVFLYFTGLGLGIFQVGNLDLTTSILSIGERGVAGSLVNVARLLGIVSGAAGITWMFDALDTHANRLLAFRDTYVILGLALLAFSLIVNATIFRRAGRATLSNG